MYITEEEDLRDILMKSLADRGVKTWDSRPERGKRGEVIWMQHLPVYLRSGDILIFWNNQYRLVELKVSLLYPRRTSKNSRKFVDTRSNYISRVQHETMIKGRGILLMMAEPTPTSLGWSDSLSGVTNEECIKNFTQKIRIPLGRSEIPYRFLLFDGARYQVLREIYLRPDKVVKKLRRRRIMAIRFGAMLKTIQPLIPDAYFTMTLDQIERSALVEKILKLI
jgi:hypothetical protein